MRLFTFIAFLLVSHLTNAQYLAGQRINPSNLTRWLPKLEIEYAGTYHFGESESESTFYLFFSGDQIVGQIHSGSWEENTGKWIMHYKTLTNVSIDKKGNFTSDQHTGQFIRYQTISGEIKKGLKIDNPWTSWIKENEFEIGLRKHVIKKDLFSGKYGKASYQLLDKSELISMKPEELKIMRNEIFARYGYIFKEGGAMERYFKMQKWYRPQHKDVTGFLTSIELRNIELIEKFE